MCVTSKSKGEIYFLHNFDIRNMQTFIAIWVLIPYGIYLAIICKVFTFGSMSQFQFQGITRTYLEVLLTYRRSDAVTFGIQQSSYLHQITVTLDCVVDHSGLHQKGVITSEYPFYAFLRLSHEDRSLAGLHKCPHALICGYF